MSHWPIAELIPHAGDMILLDAVLEHDADHVRCTHKVAADGLLHAADGRLPAWAGVELMAQAIAAWAGCTARAKGRPVRLGLLLGTRQYRCNVTGFPPGSTLTVSARREFSDATGMGVFVCRIEAPGVLAEAKLTVFSPPDATALFATALSHD